jgi:hypothetical protein
VALGSYDWTWRVGMVGWDVVAWEQTCTQGYVVDCISGSDMYIDVLILRSCVIVK